MEMEEEDDESDGEEKRLETKDRYVEGKARKPAEAQKAQRMQDTRQFATKGEILCFPSVLTDTLKISTHV